MIQHSQQILHNCTITRKLKIFNTISEIRLYYIHKFILSLFTFLLLCLNNSPMDECDVGDGLIVESPGGSLGNIPQN